VQGCFSYFGVIFGIRGKLGRVSVLSVGVLLPGQGSIVVGVYCQFRNLNKMVIFVWCEIVNKMIYNNKI